MGWSLVWTLLAGIAHAAPNTPEPVTWDRIADAATEAWTRAEGASMQAHIEGADLARRAAADLPTLTGGTRLGSLTNQEAVATLQAPIGFGIRPRARWSTHADALRAEADADRQRFVEHVVEAWTTWWTASELVEHLDAWSAEVEATLAPLDAAVTDGVSAPLDAEDMRAELATVRAEAAAAGAEAVRAEASLRMLLGQDAVLDAGDEHLHDLDVAHLANPWHDLVDRAADAPVVRADVARAEALQAQAKELATWRPVLEAGVAFADGNGPFEPLAVVGLSAPLRPSGLAAARETRALAAAEAHQATWRTDRVEGAWRAEAAGFDADHTRIDRIDREVVEPLASRLARLEDAFADGLVPADRVIRARRDHHEAEHERLLLTARLLASSARADTVRRLLETP